MSVMFSAPFGHKKTALRLQSGAFILWWFATFPDLDIHAERYKNIGNMFYFDGITAEFADKIIVIAVVIIFVHLDFSAPDRHFAEPIPNAHENIHPPVAARTAF